ncbi:MAG: DUF362 domain-containing protein [candidate division Zixibacteria bacterium]|nr:DUF362 domain-containing protein [candidate division Zixibacteria bacterium]
MIDLTKQEKQLKIVMTISAIIYFAAGLAFALLPEIITNSINLLSRIVMPGLAEMPVSTEKFWLALAFSMMMTITILSAIAGHNIRKNKGYIVPVLVSKAISSLSSLGYFVLSAKYFAYIVIFIVDGALFWITLIFFLRASRSFFEAQTFYLKKKPVVPKNTGPTTVVSLKGDDKFKTLDKVLGESGFFGILDRHFKQSGKTKDAFRVVIKPNFMFMHSKKDHSTYTDPALVEALIDKIAERGFSDITIVEAQSTLGNYYTNREVIKIAEYIGYSTEKNYRIVDLTEEMTAYDYGGRLGKHFVGPTWRDADFRVSFAKNKTHVFCHYTLTLKNIYGTLPLQNKLKEYHTKREYDWPTIETLKHFPVHFGLVDAFYSADGHFGVIVDPKPNRTRTIIGGENLLAVDWVGAKKMGLDPDNPKVGRFLPLAVEAFGKPEINWIGDKSVYEPWQNASEIFIQSLDIIEEAYAFSDWWFCGLTAMDKYFAIKKKALPIYILRKILKPIKRIFYRYDYM